MRSSFARRGIVRSDVRSKFSPACTARQPRSAQATGLLLQRLQHSILKLRQYLTQLAAWPVAASRLRTLRLEAARAAKRRGARAAERAKRLSAYSA